MFKSLKPQDKYYLFGIICVLVLTLFIDLHIRSRTNENDKLHNKKERISEITERIDLKNSVSKMAFVEYSMPRPPFLQVSDKHEQEIKAEQEHSSKVDTANLALKNIKKQDSPTSSAIERHYDHLASLGQGDLSFRFPSSTKTSASIKVLEFMHQCIGIGIAAYNGESLIRLNNIKAEYSKIMRLSDGIRTPAEQGLMLSYAPGRHLVRLYPSWFDIALAKHISQTIGNDALQQISGEYYLSPKGLHLREIVINHNKISQTWLLANMC